MTNNNDDLLIESFANRKVSLRIAIVTETFPPEINGVAMTLGRIVQGLIDRGHQVQVVRPRQVGEADPSRMDVQEILSRGAPLPSYGELRFGLPAKNRLSKIWSEGRPDIVHVVTEGPLGWSAVAAARKLHLPVTSSFHTNFHSYSKHYGMGLLKRPIDSYLRKLHNRTMATLVPTQALASELTSRGYKNIGLLSRGVDTQIFHPKKRSAELRASWGVTDNNCVVLHVGRIAKEKNIGALVASFQAIQVNHPKARLVFVGDGPLRAALQAQFPDFIFVGMKKGEDLAAHYASADVFPFGSLTETFGNVVPEALASGLAVVSFARGAAFELITHSINGILVEGESQDAFVKASVALADNVSLINLLRLAGPRSVEHLAWDRIYDGFVETLTSVVVRHGGIFASEKAHALHSTISRATA